MKPALLRDNKSQYFKRLQISIRFLDESSTVPVITRKQLEPRIPINVKTNHRSFIVLVGDKGRDQVCLLKSSFACLRIPFAVDCKPPLFTLSS